MSDTPRTDEAVDYASNFHPDCEVVNVEVAIDLERELAEARGVLVYEQGGIHATACGWAAKYAEATEQRDTLAESLELFLSRVRYTSVFMNGNPTGGTFDYRSHGFDAEVELAHKALAATKGGSHE